MQRDSQNELIMLREMVESAGLGLIIKIGWCYEVYEIGQSKLLSTTSVMAPMIGPTFAMNKYKGAVNEPYLEKRIIRKI